MPKSRSVADLLHLRKRIECEIDKNYDELSDIQEKIWPRPKTKSSWDLRQQKFHIAILDSDMTDRRLTVINFSYTDHKGKMVRSWYEESYSGPEDERLWQHVHRDSSKLSEQGPVEQLAWLEGWKTHVNVDPSKEHLARRHCRILKRIHQIRQRGWPIYEQLSKIVQQAKNESKAPDDCEYYKVFLGNNIVGCLIKNKLYFEDLSADIVIPDGTKLNPSPYYENALKRKRDLRNVDIHYK